MNKDCIFCKIIAGEMPSSTLYEDKNVLAFLDIQPVNHGHTLVVPKEHHETPLETPDALLACMMSVAKKVTPAITRAIGASGFNITFNSGRVAGQVVPHTHLHIIPRHEDDGLKLWPQEPYSDGEQERVAEKIKKELASQ